MENLPLNNGLLSDRENGQKRDHKIMKLKKRHEFLFVAQGIKASGRFLSLQARKNENSGELVRFGLTASKRVGNAVIRNRARRRLAPIMNNVLPRLGVKGFDYVAIARPQTIEANYKALLDEVEFLVKRLKKPSSFSKT
jgi:ribonuclease P protein component